MTKTYTIQEDVLRAVLNYLATQPYNEVANLVQAVLKAQVVENTEKTDEVHPS